MPGAFRQERPGERPTTPDRAYGVPRRGGAMIGWSECIERLRAAEAAWRDMPTATRWRFPAR